MTDYSSWKVADLKTELKKRGIPQTGLRLKQQIIDKLVEQEQTQTQTEGSVTPTNEPEAQPADEPEPEKEPEAQPAPEEAPAPVQEPESKPSPKKEEPAQYEEEPSHSSGTIEGEEETKEDIKEDAPVEEPVEQQPTAEASAKEESAEDAEVAPAPAAAPEDEEMKDQPTEQATAEGSEPAEEIKTSVPSAMATSEANTELSTPLPIEEALEDKRKRKRRSQSPVPTPEAIAAKKARAQDGSPRVLLKDNEEPSTQVNDDKVPPKEEQSIPTAPKMQREPSAARFKGLFASNGPAPVQPPQPPADVIMEDAVVEPALHPATAALYIDGLMRPLQPNALRNHLVSLATAPDSDPNPEIIQDFFLDAIKTHCFASFADVNAASRVRAAIHGTIWPNERNRKALRADFIPETKVKEWIQTEESSRDRAGPPTRWEVRYERQEGGEGMQAVLAEAGPPSRAQPPSRPREAGFNRTPPLGPRGSVAQADRRASNAPPAPPSRPGQGFKPLDDLFESTTTKPKLYYQRVPRKVADKRLDQFDDLLQKGTFPRAGGDDMRRITFEDEDYFVDSGPEYASNARGGPRGGRGRGGGGGGRRRR